MTTWAEIVALVLRDSGAFGVGQTAQAQDTSDCVRRLNMMLNQWKRRRWLVYHLIEKSVVCDGSLFYTIGAGQQIDYPRPDLINAAFARQITQAQPNQPDFPLRIIHSYEEYSQIALKRLSAGPSWALFYDSGYPVGKLYPYPLMNSQYSLHVLVKAELDTVVSTASTIVLPPEYEFAIYTNLMVLTRSAYRLPADPVITGQAKAALETIRSANFQVGTMNMPAAVNGYGAYNINSDTFGPWGR